jgi:hypothetical protein
MPLYVHRVEAEVVPDGGGAEAPRSLKPQEFQALVAAVVHELERRQERKQRTAADASITGRNQPPSIGT